MKIKNEVAKVFEQNWKDYRGIASKVTRAEMSLQATKNKFDFSDAQIRACIRFPHLTVEEMSKNWK